MDNSHRLQRFQILHPLHTGQGVRLDLVRDAVSETTAWLLQAEGPWGPSIETMVILRQRAAAQCALTELDAEPFEIIESADTLVIKMHPIEGEPWAIARSRGDLSESDEAELEARINELRSVGLAIEEIDPAMLWATPAGPRLLPSAWLLPPLPGEGLSTAPFRDFGATELDPRLRSALDGLEENSCLEVQSAPSGVEAASILAWAASSGLAGFMLRPDHAVLVPKLRDRRPALVILDRVARLADVAEPLAALSRQEVLDGRERLVVLRPASSKDQVLDDYLDARYEGRRSRVDDLDGAIADPRLSIEDLTPSARSILDIMASCGGALTCHEIGNVLGLDASLLAIALLQLESKRLLSLEFGIHASAPAAQASATLRVPIELDAARSAELRRIHAASIEGVASRRLSGSWWRARHLHAAQAPSARKRLRELALRAEARDLPLLALAAYGALVTIEPPDDRWLEDEIRFALGRARAAQRAGRVDAAHEVLQDALELTDDAPPAIAPLLAELVFRLVQLDLHRSDFSAAEGRLQELLERAKERLAVEPRARAYTELGWAQLHLGRTRESVRTSELALRILDPLQHTALVARVHNQIGFALYKQSDYPGSIVHYERALRLRDQLGDSLGVARTHNNLALSHLALGQVSDAEQCLRESLRLKRAAGDLLSLAASLLNLGFVQLEKGDPSAARESATQCLEIARSRQHPETEAEAWGLLGEAEFALGDAPSALQSLERDLEICTANGHDAERLATLRRLGQVLLELDRHDEAAESLETARALLVAQPSRFENAMLDHLEAEILARSEAPGLAVDSFASASRGFAAVGRVGQQLESLARRGEVEIELGRGERARASLAEALELMGRHEIHHVPDAVDRLERMLRGSSGEAQPLSPDACLELLVETLDADSHGLRRAYRNAANLVTAFGAEELIWVDESGVARSPRSDGWMTVALAAELQGLELGADDFLRIEGLVCLGLSREGGGGWIGVRRGEPLREHEQHLLRGMVRAWHGRSLGPAAEPSEAPEDTIPDPGDVSQFGLIGHSEGMRQVLRLVQRVASTDVSVLILGENGTGKELVARALHDAGTRRSGPFVAVNCASIPANLLESELFGHERGAFTSAHARRIGRFEQAQGGTLLLDEIGEMPADMQAKLLRVLQERTFTRVGGSETLSTDARILAATNRNLQAEVEAGRFRVDLFYRLNVVTIEIPPLRDRVDDIEALAWHFLRRDAQEHRGSRVELSHEALGHLCAYAWPGNVRELENAIRSALVFGTGELLRAEDLPLSGTSTGATASAEVLDLAVDTILDAETWGPDRPLLPRVELLLVHEMVLRVGNKTEAARRLGITKPTLYDRLRRFDALFGSDDEANR